MPQKKQITFPSPYLSIPFLASQPHARGGAPQPHRPPALLRLSPPPDPPKALHDGEAARTRRQATDGRAQRKTKTGGEMAAASFTAAKPLAPLVVRSGALLLGGLLRRARREQSRLRR
jgi:hypothetical protein